jgi:hypothetical protein
MSSSCGTWRRRRWAGRPWSASGHTLNQADLDYPKMAGSHPMAPFRGQEPWLGLDAAGEVEAVGTRTTFRPATILGDPPSRLRRLRRVRP